MSGELSCLKVDCKDVLSDELPRAGADGFFELDGVRYGTLHGWMKDLGIERYHDTPFEGVRGTLGKTALGRILTFFSQEEVQAIFPERFSDDLVRADENGFFVKAGVRYGHKAAWNQLLGLTIQKALSAGIDGFTAGNQFLSGGFFPETQIRALYPDRFACQKCVADSYGFFLVEGERYGYYAAWESFLSRVCFRKMSDGLDGYTSANKLVSGGFYRKQQLILAYPNLFEKHVEALLATFEVRDFSDWLVGLRQFYDFLELGPVERLYPVATVNLFLDWSRSLSRRFPLIKRYLKLLEDRPKQVVESNRKGYSHECVYLAQKDLELWVEQGQPTKEISGDLISRAQAGDPIAEADFVRKYERLVKNLAYKYKGALSLEDAMQEGMIGLLRALKKYDASKGSFVNHAKWWIRAGITNVAPGAGTSLDLPKSLLWARRMLIQAAGETSISGVPVEELARRTGLTAKRIKAVLKDSTPTVLSLDAPVGFDGDGARLHEFIAAPVQPDPVVKSAFQDFLREAAGCAERNGYSSYWEVFLGAISDSTPKYAPFAAELGVSRETVRKSVLAMLDLILDDPVCSELLLEMGAEEAAFTKRFAQIKKTIGR